VQKAAMELIEWRAYSNTEGELKYLAVSGEL